MFKLIQLIFFSLLLAVLGCALLGGAGVSPGWALGLSVVGVVALWAYGIRKAVQQAQEIERLRVAAVQARRKADEAQAEADRLARIADADVTWQRIEARKLIGEFINPN
jgi:uncharacterized protein YacL